MAREIFKRGGLLLVGVVLALACFSSCRSRGALTMTCQYNFLDARGGCSFINQTTLAGGGCVRAEVMRVGESEALDSVILCADHVPPMQTVTRTLSFKRSVVESCTPILTPKKGGGTERVERCILRLSEVKK